MSRRARRKELPRKNDSRPTMPFSVPDKNIEDRPTCPVHGRSPLSCAWSALAVGTVATGCGCSTTSVQLCRR